MPKLKTQYVCSECAHLTVRWLGRCPECGRYNTLEEEVVEQKKPAAAVHASAVLSRSQVKPLAEISPMAEDRIKTNVAELDRVLSGGIVEGSLVLVGGDPGIGKSTLLLQICQSVGKQNKRILYVSGEESVQQIKLRAERLKITTPELFVQAETNFGVIEAAVAETSPKVLIIDSIQTMYKEDVASGPGSVTQVRECTQSFMRMAKTKGISIILVGHVTKEGGLAGPKILEHMVDTVLYFEGERRESYRMIRTVKNRFGATNEIGIFEMRDSGLREIPNPSAYMLSGRPIGVSGSAVTCSMEGTRPILAEVQALVSYTSFGMPRRMATGMDYNRVVMLIAVLEKRAGLQLNNYDSYLNIAGGMKINEPAIDAAVVAAAASSYRNKIIDPYTLIFGEVGLTGEMRAVTMAEKRLAECGKLGFKQVIMPQANLKGIKKPEGLTVYGASNISELLELALD